MRLLGRNWGRSLEDSWNSMGNAAREQLHELIDILPERELHWVKRYL